MIWTNCESERDEISKGYKGYSCHMLIYRYESNMYIFFCTWDGLEPCRLRERERHNFHVRINTIKYAFFVFFLICKLYTYKSYMYVIEHVFLYKNIYIFLTLCLEEPAGVQESQCRLCHGSSGIPREHQESFHGVPSVRSQWDEVETSGSRVVFEIKLPDHQWSPTNGTFQGGRWSVDFF